MQLDVVVTNPDGQSGTLAGGYTVTFPAPAVVSVSPSSGPATGGTSVTVTGSNFQSGATVLFGSKPATNVVVVSATEITCVTPSEP